MTGPAALRLSRGWFIAGLGLAQIVSWGALYYSFPLFAEPMGRELGIGKPEIYGAATFGLAVAGFAAYPIGAAIDRGHGRMVMVGGSVLGGVLLLAWSRVDSLWALYPLMAGIGLAQAMTLYEPAFAVIVRRFGAEARQSITTLTLWGGFASTVFVPLIQFLLDHRSWRETLAILGSIVLGLCVPLHLAVIGPGRPIVPGPPGETAPLQGRAAVRWAVRQPIFWALAITFTFYYGIFSGLTYHLYPMLLERHFDAATVVGTIAIIGPAQVASRVVMWLSGAQRSIRSIGVVTVAMLPVAMLLLMLLPSGFAALAGFAVLLGGANGIMTILRGVSVPEMLTREAYGAINGALAVPSTIARAISPLAAALLWSATGSYEPVLVVALAGFSCGAAAFWFAAARRVPGH